MARTHATATARAISSDSATPLATPSAGSIPEVTIETLARGFCREAAGYGFGQIDFVKFVNAVLDQSMAGGTCPVCAPTRGHLAPAPADATRLPLQGVRVAIRSLAPAADLPILERWLTDARGRDFLLSRATAKAADVEELVRDPRNSFGVIVLPDATPIGAVAFLDHDPVQRKAEMRKLIGEPAQRGKGLAKEASSLWIRYGLAGLGLRKIFVSTFHTSVRNVRLNEELGFRLEGILRNEVLVDGAYQDVLRMGLWCDGEPGAPAPAGESDPD
jgi:RimJ/RimL family protein N-acetyltransferase